MNNLEVSCHLIIGAGTIRGTGQEAWHSGKPSVRVAKSKPALRSNEIAIALKLTLPLALFQRPDLNAEIVVPAEKKPFLITPEIQQRIAEQIREQTGFTVALTVTGEAE
jgi:hypothetical protein